MTAAGSNDEVGSDEQKVGGGVMAVVEVAADERR
jgi:hypothetical protein